MILPKNLKILYFVLVGRKGGREEGRKKETKKERKKTITHTQTHKTFVSCVRVDDIWMAPRSRLATVTSLVSVETRSGKGDPIAVRLLLQTPV